jgi:hypothetical protein
MVKEAGSLAALARHIQRPEQTLGSVIDGKGLREATAIDYDGILHSLGFVGLTGLEPRTLSRASRTSGEHTHNSNPPPAAA